MSTFFTLSGFLITTLLLDEHRRSTSIALGRFWSRRLRRLLSAAVVTLLAIALAAPFVASADQLARLRGDLVAALAQVANWRFLAEGRSYGASFAAPSPVLHFWSLAIEAQFYVVFPLVVVAVSRLARGRRFRAALAAVFVAVAAGGTALAAVVGTDAAYYSTLARAPELLAGALLALALPLLGAPGDRIGRPARPERGWRVWVAGAGAVALPLLLVAWSRTPVTSASLARGGFALHALASAAVVGAAAVDAGVVAAALSVRPLAWLGRISYGAYLFHWPIFVWLTPERAGVRGAPLVGVQVAITLALAALSERLVELPVRRGRPALGRSGWAASTVAALVVVVIAAVVVTRDVAPRTGQDFRDGVSAAAPVSPPSPPGLPRVAVFGDSTALRTAFGLPLWGIRTRRIAMVADDTVIGCGLAHGGTINATGTARPVLPECDGWPARWRARVAELDLDGAVLQVGPWDVADRRLPGESTWRHVGQPELDAVVKAEMREAVDALSSSGAKVIWLTSPVVDMNRAVVPRPTKPAPSSDPARMARLNQLIAEVAAERPDVVRVVDVAAHLRERPAGELDPAIRPDGVHLTEEAAVDLAAWLGPEVLAAIAR